MNKKILSVAFALALLLPVGALAQISSTTPLNTKEEFRSALEAKRAQAESRLKEHQDALRTRLQKIKDEKKKATVEKIDAGIADLNKRITDHYANVLDQIDSVLSRVIIKVDKAQADGKDVSAVRVKITEAQNAISAARTKVANQAGKTYTIAVSTDAKLKVDVGQARKALHDDLDAAKEVVKAAREAVRFAVLSLAQISENKTNSTSTNNQ